MLFSRRFRKHAAKLVPSGLPPLCALCDADKRHFHSWAAPHPLEDGMCQGRVQHPQMCPWQQSIHLLMTQDNLISKWTRSYSSLGLPLFIPSAFWPVKDRALQRPCAGAVWGMGCLLMRKLQQRLLGSSLAVQWLGLSAFTVGAPASIPGRETKIPQPTQHSQKYEQYPLKRVPGMY